MVFVCYLASKMLNPISYLQNYRRQKCMICCFYGDKYEWRIRIIKAVTYILTSDDKSSNKHH